LALKQKLASFRHIKSKQAVKSRDKAACHAAM
jgi:hypothetical protein